MENKKTKESKIKYWEEKLKEAELTKGVAEHEIEIAKINLFFLK